MSACSGPSLHLVLMASYVLRARVLRSASFSRSLTLLFGKSRRRTPVAECARTFILAIDSTSGFTESSKSLQPVCRSALLRSGRDRPAAFAMSELAEIDIRCAIMDGVYVCKSTELYLPAVVAMTVPAGIVNEAEAGIVVKGALCSMSFGVVREETLSASSPHESSRSCELFELELTPDEDDVVDNWVTAVVRDLASEEPGECKPITVFPDRPESESSSRRPTCSCAGGFGRLRGIVDLGLLL